MISTLANHGLDLAAGDPNILQVAVIEFHEMLDVASLPMGLGQAPDKKSN
jgi:hypothetical protein